METAPINILYAEDDNVDIMSFQRMLKKNAVPHHLCIANNGREALEHLRGVNGRDKFIPDIIFTDINMPQMNGLEMMKAVREDAAIAAFPIVVLTTSDLEADRNEAMKHAAINYFVKPIDIAYFLEVTAGVRKQS